MLWNVLSRRMPALLIDDVDAAEGVERRLHDGLAAFRCGDRVGVGDGLAARRLDLVDDQLGRAGIAAGAVDGAAEVVDHDQRAASRRAPGRAGGRARRRRP